MKVEVSYFERIDAYRSYTITAGEVFEKIRNGEFQDAIDEIRRPELRGGKNKSKRTALKQGNLPVVTFNGIFKDGHGKANLKQASGLLTVDFDDLPNNRIPYSPERWRDKFFKFPYVYFAFVSPSGDGVKAGIRIPPCKDDAEYKTYLYSFATEQPYSDWKNTSDISRLTFLSFDPDIKVRPLEEVKVWQHVVPLEMKGVLKLMLEAKQPNRHNTILEQSQRIGQWIASGKVDRGFIVEQMIKLANLINNDGPEDQTENERAVTWGIENPFEFGNGNAGDRLSHPINHASPEAFRIYYYLTGAINTRDYAEGDTFIPAGTCVRQLSRIIEDTAWQGQGGTVRKIDGRTAKRAIRWLKDNGLIATEKRNRAALYKILQ